MCHSSALFLMSALSELRPMRPLSLLWQQGQSRQLAQMSAVKSDQLNPILTNHVEKGEWLGSLCGKIWAITSKVIEENQSLAPCRTSWLTNLLVTVNPNPRKSIWHCKVPTYEINTVNNNSLKKLAASTQDNIKIPVIFLNNLMEMEVYWYP